MKQIFSHFDRMKYAKKLQMTDDNYIFIVIHDSFAYESFLWARRPRLVQSYSNTKGVLKQKYVFLLLLSTYRFVSPRMKLMVLSAYSFVR